ncbi:DUF975 family protein [Pseudoflavonifractor phocaeensis]|uniref:DUF975 family protein n=1 Tax=Pseudoflavonifractor phocaeensis TaxID=1870988 RepID=UPI001956B3F5|nr:DUF975 family protein [Pseudoflavonifractor phocaeensis]MBM6723576.1 DUF975 family protein [Pseudoflavonifractor phocaeensis]
MGFNRPEAKYRARMAMQGAYPHPMLVTLVYVLLTSVITNVIMFFVSDPFTTAYLYILDGADVDEVYRYILTGPRVTVYLLVQLLITLYLWVMQFGYTAYGLGLARRTGPGYRTLLEGFLNLGKALLVSFLTALFVVLWGLLGMVPGIVLTFVGALMGPLGLGLVILGMVGMIGGGVALEVVMSYRYRLAIYYLLDHPDMGVLESISNSKQTMKGKKIDLFVMDLSFLGWLILSVFTLGILGLWVSPYLCASEANFYHWAVNGVFPGDDGVGKPSFGGQLPGGPTSGGPDSDSSGPSDTYHSPYGD